MTTQLPLSAPISGTSSATAEPLLRGDGGSGVGGSGADVERNGGHADSGSVNADGNGGLVRADVEGAGEGSMSGAGMRSGNGVNVGKGGAGAENEGKSRDENDEDEDEDERSEGEGCMEGEKVTRDMLSDEEARRRWNSAWAVSNSSIVRSGIQTNFDRLYSESLTGFSIAWSV